MIIPIMIILLIATIIIIAIPFITTIVMILVTITTIIIMIKTSIALNRRGSGAEESSRRLIEQSAPSFDWSIRSTIFLTVCASKHTWTSVVQY